MFNSKFTQEKLLFIGYWASRSLANRRRRLLDGIVPTLARRRRAAETDGGGSNPVEVRDELVPKTLTPEYVKAQFDEAFPALTSRVDTYDKIISLVSISSVVRTWYLGLKEDVSTVSSLPDSMQRGGVTPDDWKSAQSDVEGARALERRSASAISAAAQKFKEALDKVADDKRKFYNRVSPLVVISRISIEQLSLEDQAEIAVLADKAERKRLTREKIEQLQTELSAEWKAGRFVNPFE